jgi:hypothetical protein
MYSLPLAQTKPKKLAQCLSWKTEQAQNPYFQKKGRKGVTRRLSNNNNSNNNNNNNNNNNKQ